MLAAGADFVILLSGLRASGLLEHKMRAKVRKDLKKMAYFRLPMCSSPFHKRSGIRLRIRGQDVEHTSKTLSSTSAGASVEWKARLRPLSLPPT
jgi:hypothetical protein